MPGAGVLPIELFLLSMADLNIVKTQTAATVSDNHYFQSIRMQAIDCSNAASHMMNEFKFICSYLINKLKQQRVIVIKSLLNFSGIILEKKYTDHPVFKEMKCRYIYENSKIQTFKYRIIFTFPKNSGVAAKRSKKIQ